MGRVSLGRTATYKRISVPLSLIGADLNLYVLLSTIVMGKMEDCYPQLLETIFACYAPSFMHWIWTFIRPIMPKRVVEKIDVIEPNINENERRRLLKHVASENLPVDYGGTSTTPILEM